MLEEYLIPNLDLDKYILPMKEANLRDCQFFVRITDVCNKDCDFCSHKYLKTGKHMDFEDFKLLCDSNAKFGDEICILGGEPTAHRDFDKMLKYAQSVYPSVMVLTNGLNPIDDLRYQDEITYNGLFLKELDLSQVSSIAKLKVSYLFNEYDLDDETLTIMQQMRQINKRFMVVVSLSKKHNRPTLRNNPK
jgi:organic radical activating enzyme